MWFGRLRAAKAAQLRSRPLIVAAMIGAVFGALEGVCQGPQAAHGPEIAGCAVFPADNVWNAPIDKLPVDPRSKDYIARIGADIGVHPDFGADPTNGIPITVVDAKVKGVKVVFEYRDESDPGDYPIPPNAAIEGSAARGDRHIILVDKDRCELLELFAVQAQKDGSWKAGSGIKMDLTSDGLRDDGATSADAAGLPILPGLIRNDEVAAGEIRHALRFTAPKTQQAHIWPARHDASSNTDPRFPPMGVRLRLRADFDISGFSKTNQVILTALKRYGMFLADNGSPWFITGAPDPRWNDDELHTLNRVKGSDFEAVDESGWRYVPHSGRVDPMVLH